jgi:hypothetical protein
MLRVILAGLTSVILVSSAALAQASLAAAGPRAPVAPLFASHDPLVFTIEAPLTTIFKDRGKERNERPAKLILPATGGQPTALKVDIRTRGKTRADRRTCEFPPLRLDFDTAGGGTVFESQNALKLVTHCQDGRAEYDQYVLQEYLVYRVYNLLSDISFKVRLARVTYVDTDGKREAVTRNGFLVEDVDDVAARNGWQALRVPAVPPQISDPPTLALVEVFMYFIGNPDWSLFTIEPGEESCCHNTVPIGAGDGPVFSIPYDFDIAGIVNTRYADRLFAPQTRNMGIRSVRDRAYRGLCGSADHLPAVFALFNQKREAIYALYREQPGLHPEVLKETVEYLDAFYEAINDPKKVKREFTDRCVGG